MGRDQIFTVLLVGQSNFVARVKSALDWHRHFVVFALEVCVVRDRDQVLAFANQVFFLEAHNI